MFESPIDIIGDLIGRVDRLEQTRNGNWVTVGGTDVPVFPGGFAIGPNDEFVFTDVAIPTNVTATSGTFFEVAYILVDWDAPVTTDQIVGYRIELYKVGQGIARTIETGGTNARFEPVEPNTNYTVTVTSLNKFRKPSAAVTATPNPILTKADDTIPAAPTGVVASSNTTARSVQVRWTENTEIDVKAGHGLYEWEISTSNAVDGNGNFTVSPRRDRTSGTIILAVDLVGSTTYYAHVRAIDSSNNFGPWSSIVSAIPGLLSDLDVGTLNGSHINVGTLHGDRLQANSVSATTLTTSELNAAIVTITSGGMIRMGRTTAPFHYAVRDTNGDRFYTNGTAPFTGGTLMMDLNVATGSAFFGGTLAAGVSLSSPVITGGSLTTQNATFGATPSLTWAVIGTWGIINNEAYNTNALGADATYTAIIDSGDSDGLWSLKVRTSPTADRTQCGIIFRYVDNNNYWLAEIRDRAGAGNNGVYLWRRVAGVTTLETSWTAKVNIGPNEEHLIRVFTAKDSFHLYLNQTHYRTVIDSALMTATKGGMYISKGATLDDGGTRFLEFSRQSASDNFNRANSSVLGSTTTDSKVFVDGSGLAALNPVGGVAFRLYSGSGDIVSNGVFSADLIHLNVANIANAVVDQITSVNANGKIVVAGHPELNQNKIYFDTIINKPNSWIAWLPTHLAPVLQGDDATMMRSQINNSGLICNSNATGSVNFGNTGFIEHAASNIAPSDQAFKSNIVVLDRTTMVTKFRNTKPKKFKKQSDKTNRDHLGFIAQEVPLEAQYLLPPVFTKEYTEEELDKLKPGDIEKKQYIGYKIEAMLAILWEMTQDIDDRLDLIEKRKGV